MDPKGRSKKVRGGNDQDNLENSYHNITRRDVPNVVKGATLGKVTFRPGRGITIKP
jgi:hypothetical protein